MKVINFPGGDWLNQTLPKLRKEILPSSPQDRLILGDASFTCPTCSNKTTIEFKGMIFRSLEFHCSKCGTRHKISNPAFTPQTSIKKPPHI